MQCKVSLLDGSVPSQDGQFCVQDLFPESDLDIASSSFEGPSFLGSLSSPFDVCVFSEIVEGTCCHLVSPCRLLYMRRLQKAICCTRAGYLSM